MIDAFPPRHVAGLARKFPTIISASARVNKPPGPVVLAEELEDRFRSSLRIYKEMAIFLPEVEQAPSMVVVVDQVADLS